MALGRRDLETLRIPSPEAHFPQASLVIVPYFRHTVIRMETALQEWRLGKGRKIFKFEEWVSVMN